MINETFVEFETAQTLQELGYDGEFDRYVEEGGRYHSRDSFSIYDWMIPCPRLEGRLSSKSRGI